MQKHTYMFLFEIEYESKPRKNDSSIWIYFTNSWEKYRDFFLTVGISSSAGQSWLLPHMGEPLVMALGANYLLAEGKYFFHLSSMCRWHIHRLKLTHTHTCTHMHTQWSIHSQLHKYKHKCMHTQHVCGIFETQETQNNVCSTFQ